MTKKNEKYAFPVVLFNRQTKQTKEGCILFSFMIIPWFKLSIQTQILSTTTARDPPIAIWKKLLFKILSLEEEINGDIDRLVDLKREIMETISQVNDLNYQVLLEMRYISGKSWEEVSEELNYSIRGVFKLRLYCTDPEKRSIFEGQGPGSTPGLFLYQDNNTTMNNIQLDI